MLERDVVNQGTRARTSVPSGGRTMPAALTANGPNPPGMACSEGHIRSDRALAGRRNRRATWHRRLGRVVWNLLRHGATLPRPSRFAPVFSSFAPVFCFSFPRVAPNFFRFAPIFRYSRQVLGRGGTPASPTGDDLPAASAWALAADAHTSIASSPSTRLSAARQESRA